VSRYDITQEGHIMRRIILFLFLLCVFNLLTIVAVISPAYSDGQGPPCGKGKQSTRFVLFDSGSVVCDNASGLQWERSPVNAVRTFADATSYCAAKGSGWTVPAIQDFFTVVDYATANPPLPSGHPFEIPVNGEYWSRTAKVGSADEVWSFVLDFGRTFFANKSGTADYVWCVRY
jgi:hypothetical protein